MMLLYILVLALQVSSIFSQVKISTIQDCRKLILKDPCSQKQLLKDLLDLEFPKNRAFMNILIVDELNKITEDQCCGESHKILRPKSASLKFIIQNILEKINDDPNNEEKEQIDSDKTTINLIFGHLNYYLPRAEKILSDANTDLLKIFTDFEELEKLFLEPSSIEQKLKILNLFFTNKDRLYIESIKPKNQASVLLKKYTKEKRLEIATSRCNDFEEDFLRSMNNLKIPPAKQITESKKEQANDSQEKTSSARRLWRYFKSFIT
jgi:hypothetical protein